MNTKLVLIPGLLAGLAICSCDIFVVTPEPVPVWVAKQETLIDDQIFAVDPGEFVDAHFTITLTSDVRDVWLSGDFVAAGGSGDDIKAYLFDATNYGRFHDGLTAAALYASGQVHSGDFDVEIESGGTYYLVFDNRFSVVTQKAVNVNLYRDYEQLQ